MFKKIFAYTIPYKKQFAVSLLLGLCLAIMAPLRPYLVQYSIDHYIEKNILMGLVVISLIQIGLVGVESFFRFLFSYVSSWMGQNIIQRIRGDLFRKILSLNVRQFDKTPVGIFSTRSIDDCERINDIFSDGILPVIVDIGSVLAVLGYMFYLDAGLALVALSPFPILLIASYFFKNSVNRSFNKVRTAVAQLNVFTNEQLSGIKTLKAFGGNALALDGFNRHNEMHKRENIKSIAAYSIFFPLVEIISALSIGALIWWGTGKENSKPGELISFIVCINTIFRPLRIIADKFNTIQMGMLAAKRVFAVMDNEDVTPSGNYIPEHALRGDIAFRNLSFSYDDSTWVLKNVSFHIKHGENVAILGRTGSGKTSIVSLINRMYQHQVGEIKIDGRDIAEYDSNYLRSQIGYVSQDVFLFGGSVYENICVGNPNLHLDEVKAICQKLGIHPMIEALPHQYHFQVHEGGGNLSSGQRQLISVARVFAKSPSIIIFDEATSSIDPHIEEVIDFACQELFRGKTSIIIAHRRKTILKAEKVIVLKDGEILEQGEAKTLKAGLGYYAQLFQET